MDIGPELTRIVLREEIVINLHTIEIEICELRSKTTELKHSFDLIPTCVTFSDSQLNF